jgi:hypothetical protein
MAIMEMQIKTTLRFHHTPVRKSTYKDTQQMLVGMQWKWNFHNTAGGDVN